MLPPKAVAHLAAKPGAHFKTRSLLKITAMDPARDLRQEGKARWRLDRAATAIAPHSRRWSLNRSRFTRSNFVHGDQVMPHSFNCFLPVLAKDITFCNKLIPKLYLHYILHMAC
jgi:hypothetical protein